MGNLKAQILGPKAASRGVWSVVLGPQALASVKKILK